MAEQEIDLRDINLRSVPVDTVVISKKGFKFKLIKRTNNKESWLDITSGLVWHDREDWTGNQETAMEKFRKSIPTKKQWEVAMSHGAQDVLPNMGVSYWSKSIYPVEKSLAYLLEASYCNLCKNQKESRIHHYARCWDTSYVNASIRLVSRGDGS